MNRLDRRLVWSIFLTAIIATTPALAEVPAGELTTLAAGAGPYSSPRFANDGSSGLYAAWLDASSGWPTVQVLKLTRLAPGWTRPQAVAVSAAGSTLREPSLVGVPDGVVVTWKTFEDGFIHIQKLDPKGAARWPAPLRLQGSLVGLISDGAGGVFFSRHVADKLHVGHIDGTGATRWDWVKQPTSTSSPAAIVSDGAGGVVVVATLKRLADRFDITAYRLSATGEAIWPEGGVPITEAATPGRKIWQMVQATGDAFLVSWTDHRRLTIGEGYAQVVDADGRSRWPANGVVLPYPFLPPRPDGAGGAVAFYPTSDAGTTLRARRLGTSGEQVWEVDVMTGQLSTTKHTASFIPGRGIIASWLWSVAHCSASVQIDPITGTRGWGSARLEPSMCNSYASAALAHITTRPVIGRLRPPTLIIGWDNRPTAAATDLVYWVETKTPITVTVPDVAKPKLPSPTLPKPKAKPKLRPTR